MGAKAAGRATGAWRAQLPALAGPLLLLSPCVAARQAWLIRGVDAPDAASAHARCVMPPPLIGHQKKENKAFDTHSTPQTAAGHDA